MKPVTPRFTLNHNNVKLRPGGHALVQAPEHPHDRVLEREEPLRGMLMPPRLELPKTIQPLPRSRCPRHPTTHKPGSLGAGTVSR